LNRLATEAEQASLKKARAAEVPLEGVASGGWLAVG